MQKVPENTSEPEKHSIRADVLAGELGVHPYRFSEEKYAHARQAIGELLPIVYQLKDIPLHQWGKFFIQQEKEIFRIMNRQSDMSRFPLFLTKDASDAFIQLAGGHDMLEQELIVGMRMCIGYFLYIRHLHEKASLYDRYKGKLESPSLGLMARFIDDSCNLELVSIWGDMAKRYYKSMFDDETGEEYIGQFRRNPLVVSESADDEMKRARFNFWSEKNLAVERIFIQVPNLKLMTAKGQALSLRRIAEALDLPALNFFLCQTHLESYHEFMRNCITKLDHVPVWTLWIKEHIAGLVQRDSERGKVFKYVWEIEGNLFSAPGKLSSAAKRNIPKALHQILLDADNDYRERKRKEKQQGSQMLRNIVARLRPTAATPIPRVAFLATAPELPTFQTVPLPVPTKIFLQEKPKKQFTSLDLSSCGLPEGTEAILVIQQPRKQSQNIGVHSHDCVIELPQLSGRANTGHYVYELTVVLPITHRFEGIHSRKHTITSRFYAESDPTPDEIALEEARFRSLAHKSEATPNIPVQKVVEEVSEQVENIIDASAVSLTALAILLESRKADIVARYESYTGGPLELEIIPKDIDVLGGDGASLDKKNHTRWTIVENGSISPTCPDQDVQKLLQDIAGEIRHNFALREEHEQTERCEQEEKTAMRDIDGIFLECGFVMSDSPDNANLRAEVSSKIGDFIQEKKMTKKMWDEQIAGVSSLCKPHGFCFFAGHYSGGFPQCITLAKNKEWSATLRLQPELKYEITLKIPSNDLLVKRIESALLSFVYNTLRNGTHGLDGLAHETLALSNLTILKRRFRQDLRRKRARIICEDRDGKFHIIRDISRENLEEALAGATQAFGAGNVALLLRSDTYQFHGEMGVAQPSAERIRDTYRDFTDPEISSERRSIIQERLEKTLFNGRSGYQGGRSGFIPGSRVEQVLSALVREKQSSKGAKIEQGDITDCVIDEFIARLQTDGDTPVVLSYINYRVAYCVPSDIQGLTAD